MPNKLRADLSEALTFCSVKQQFDVGATYQLLPALMNQIQTGIVFFTRYFT